jgi:wyosine [tRNA(Phe)-imidazoG37] synthetase (radical SAM superfamily)
MGEPSIWAHLEETSTEIHRRPKTKILIFSRNAKRINEQHNQNAQIDFSIET